ncbi:MAG: glutamate synthase [Thermoplasmata archaeon]|nr:FAD-dependent oxidoreductase [Euryarchaeota archaeon]RLF66283.1 MAG: glutamate synthase [Thermoplasmata archaeon]
MTMNFAFMCKPNEVIKTGKKVAIIGAGPAGLAATGYLVCKGHEVHVYDKLPYPGGLMVFSIPSRRIRPEHVLEGAKILEERFSVEFNLRTKVTVGNAETHEEGDDFVEKVVKLEDIIENYDVVLIATGIWRSPMPGITGEELDGVIGALEFLYRWKTYELNLAPRDRIIDVSKKKVAVIGAGHSAVDAAMTALEIGAKDVYLLYRRTINEAPAGRYEISEAIREGIKWIELVSPVKINGTKRVSSITLVRNRLEEVPSGGRPRPVPIPGTEFDLEVDFVIFAIGERPTPPPGAEKVGIQINERYGNIQINEEFRTSVKNVFAAGDVVTGPSFVGRAIEAGLRAGRSIDRYLAKI